MILNHKRTLDHILGNPKDYIQISLKTIINLHSMLTENLQIPLGIRKRPIRVEGSSYIPLENPEKIEIALKNMSKLINPKELVYDKALIANSLIAICTAFCRW